VKHYRIYIALFLGVLALFMAVMAFDATTSHAQRGGRAGGASQVKPTASLGTAFGAAGMRNASLQNELKWQFGKKSQRGWYLYIPLIRDTLDTKHDVTSEDFAKALARWQKKSGLEPTGVLEEKTLYAMISEWQGRRLKDRSPAPPQQLLTAPATDFYDPSRLDELRQVERQTYAAYKRMVAAALDDSSLNLAKGGRNELAAGEKYLKIVSAFRSREYQDKLRRESPNAGSAGLAVNSPHFTGRALDLYVGGEPVETNDANRAIQVKRPVYLWLVRNAERFGFRPYFYEPWHWEYVR
jgi:D-alanyl-D-alanine carboxypeptidase